MASTIISTNFDPAEISLRDLMELYVTKRGINRETFFGNLSSPVFQPYMDRPAIEFFESARDELNPLQAFFDKMEGTDSKGGSQKKAFSAVKNLELNVIRQIKRLGRMDDYADDMNGFPKLTDTVVDPAKGAPRSKKIKVDPTKLGELKKKLLEYARDNPKDVPVVRAIMAQMYTGFRPKEIIEMPLNGTIREAAEDSVAKGLFLPAGIMKMDEAFAIPLSPHLESVLNGSINSINERFPDPEDALPDRMFLMDNGKPIPKGALTRVLKQIEVPGILQDARTGESIDFLTGAYDLRRMHATGVFMLGYPPDIGGAMKGRVIKNLQSGTEGPYIAIGFNTFTAEQFEPHIAYHNFIDKSFAGSLGIEGGGVRGTVMVSPSQDVVSAALDPSLNTMASLATMDQADMGSVTVPSATMPSNVVPPPAPADVSPDQAAQEADDFVRNLKGKTFTQPKFRMVGPLVAFTQMIFGDSDNRPDDDTKDTITEIAKDFVQDEAVYQTLSMGAKATRLPVTLASTFAQDAMRVTEVSDATPDPAEQSLFAAEQAASRREGEFAPGASRETPSGESVTLPRVNFYPPIGKREGENQMVLEEMFAEGDVFEGSPGDIEERRQAEIEIMSQIATQDSAIEIDKNPGFMSRN